MIRMDEIDTFVRETRRQDGDLGELDAPCRLIAMDQPPPGPSEEGRRERGPSARTAEIAPIRRQISGGGEIGLPARALGRRRGRRVHQRDRDRPRAERAIGLELADIDLIAAAGMPGRMDHCDRFAGERPLIG